MITPYTTKSGLQIGCNYQEPVKPWFPSRTENMLQASMLQAQKNNRAKPAHRIDWDGVVIVGGCIVAMVIVYAWLWGRV